jgi:ribonuclease E
MPNNTRMDGATEDESSRPARKRATRKRASAAAEPAESTSVEAAAAAPAPEPPAEAAAPGGADQAAPIRTRRRARAAAVPEEAPEPTLFDSEPAPAKAARGRKRAAPSVPAEITPPAQAEIVDLPPSEPPRLPPATTVLFMAPTEITEAPAPRARRTRAAAAAAPSAAPEAPPAPEPAAPAEPVEGVRARRTRRARRGAEEVPEAIEVAPAEPVEGVRARRTRRARRGAEEVPEAIEVAPAEPVEGVRARRTRRARRGAEEAAEAIEVEPIEPVVEPTAAEEEYEEDEATGRRRRRRGRRGRGRGKGPADEITAEEEEPAAAEAAEPVEEEGEEPLTRRRRRRRRGAAGPEVESVTDDGVVTVVKVRQPRTPRDEVQGVSGSTRLEAKRQRRRDGREQRRTRPPILSESEFLARREAVDRVMVVRERGDRTQVAVLEDGILVEHYVTRQAAATMVGNVYLGKVQNVLPSMEAAFVDIGRGRNAVLYAGEVNWDASGLEGRARSIEQALKSGDSVLVQVTKDPIGHKGARLTSHIALSGRHLVYVPNGHASGISRKLSDVERRRLRDALKNLVPDGAGVIVRTAAEGASEEDLARDVKRLQSQWDDIQAKSTSGHAPALLSSEPDLVIRVVRDLFNEDFREVVIQGTDAYEQVEEYLGQVSPDLVARVRRHTGTSDVFADWRVDEQILKGLDRKVFLPSGGHLVIDRTEAMTVVDVNTGKYTGAGGNLEETVTRNNLEAAEEIVRQLRLRDLGGIVVIDFIDMVLESNRELVLRRLTECLGRDRTKHQVTEITSLGLVQMTRKRIGQGLLEAFSETCEHCKGRGVIIHTEPVSEKPRNNVAEKVRAVAASARTTVEVAANEIAAAETVAAEMALDDERPIAEPVPGAGSDLAADLGADLVDDLATSDEIVDLRDAEDAGEDLDTGEERDETGTGSVRRRTRRASSRRRTRP